MLSLLSIYTGSGSSGKPVSSDDGSLPVPKEALFGSESLLSLSTILESSAPEKSLNV